MRFQLGGYELVMNFVVMDNAMGVADFLFGRNFLSENQVLVDLTSKKIVVRAPVQPVWNHAHTQEGDPTLAAHSKYGAPKLETYAAYRFIVKIDSYLCQRKFTLRVDNQALLWLKTYSTDQALIGRWTMALEKYQFCVEHRPRTQHRHADGLSKRSNDYHWLGRQLEKLPPVAKR